MRRLAILLLALGVLPATARADRDAAEYFCGRAGKALAGGSLDEAAELFEKALAELDGYAPALLGLADVAKKRGDATEEQKRLRACYERGQTGNLDDAERKAVTEATRRLGDVLAPERDLDELFDGYATELLTLANRAKRSGNTDLEMEALTRILHVRPEHYEAKSRLKALQGTEPATVVEGGVALFNGKDLEGWASGPPVWTVDEGHLLGEGGTAAFWNRYKTEFHGDYVIECELRVKEDHGSDPLVGIVLGAKGPYDHHGFWIWPESWRFERHTAENERSDLARRNYKRAPGGGFDRFEWQRYVITVRGKRVTCEWDGREVFDVMLPEKTCDGALGLWVQNCTLEVRRLVFRS